MNLVEVNIEKAVEWYVEKEGIAIEEVQEYPFFESLQEVFAWVYIDENDTHQDTIDTLKKVSEMDVSVVLESGAKTISEHLALSWERLVITPYGYLAADI